MKMHRSERKSARVRRRVRASCLEAMEPRVLLSAVVHPSVQKAPKRAPEIAPKLQDYVLIQNKAVSVKTKTAHKSSTSAPATYSGSATVEGGILPSQMVAAYLGTSFNFFGVSGDGTGETIAIVDAYDDPGMINSSASNFASSDLAKFDANFNLPNPPSFTKYGVSNNTVSNTLPGVDPAGPYSTTDSTDWEVEESLDVEWAHVMAPDASIVLIETNNANNGSLYSGVRAANALGVNVVSMSFGGNESSLSASTENTYNGYFNSSAGITYVASAGDSGAYGRSGSQQTQVQPQYPAASPYVLAVGGTSLSISNNAYGSETTWGYNTSSGSKGGGGGGTSILANRNPAYQSNVNSGTTRQYPDISLDANPNTGVPIYDSYDFGASTPWVPGLIGGTSLAAPLMAGLVAVADQGRKLEGLQPLNSNGLSGGMDVHSLLYSLANSTSSYAADFHDITAGDATGAYGPPPNFSPETGYDLATGLGSPVAGNLVFDLSGISSTPAASQPGITNLYFKQDATTTYTDVWVNSAAPGTGTPTYKFLDSAIGSLTYIGGSGNDTLTLNLSAGTALETSAFNINVIGSASGANLISIIGPSSGSTAFTAGGSYVDFGTISIQFSNISTVNLDPITGTNTLTVIGNAAGNDAFTVNSSSVSLNSTTFSFTDLSLITLNPGSGNTALAVNSGSVTIAPQTSGGGILTRNFSSISIASSATAVFATAPLHSDRMLVETSSLAVVGKLDLGGNDLIVHGGNLTTLTGLLGTGYAGGNWNGSGIASSAAHNDTTHLTALGSMQSLGNSFDGAATSTSDVLIKYTYYGDSNLDGKVDGIDYSRIDVGYMTAATGWGNGDFNYDNQVDGSDYTLIDNAFNTQGTAL